MTTDNFCFYLQNSLIQTSQTGGQWYSDTSPFSITWLNTYYDALLIISSKIFIKYASGFNVLSVFLLSLTLQTNCNLDKPFSLV